MNETETGVVLRVWNRGLGLNAFGTCSMDQYQLAGFPVDIFSALNKTCADNAPGKKIDFFFMSFFAPGAPTGAMC